MTVELLYIEGCPGAERLLTRLRQQHIPVQLRLIDSQAAAERERFLGSPTLRVDGHDIEPGADARCDYGVSCRLYGTANVPPETMVDAALNR